LKTLHRSQLDAYQKAAEQALTTFAQSVDIPIVLDGENEIAYFQRIYESLDIPAWAVDQSVLDECVGSILQKRMREVLQERTSTTEKSSEPEKDSNVMEKDVDSENADSSLNEENDESNQIALVLAGLSQNAHEYTPPAAAPKPVVQEHDHPDPVSPKQVAQENSLPAPVPPKQAAQENNPPDPVPSKQAAQEKITPAPAPKPVKKIATGKGVLTRGRNASVANNVTKPAPKKGPPATAKAVQTRAGRGRKANTGRGRGKGVNLSGGKNSKKNATKLL